MVLKLMMQEALAVWTYFLFFHQHYQCSSCKYHHLVIVHYFGQQCWLLPPLWPSFGSKCFFFFFLLGFGISVQPNIVFIWTTNFPCSVSSCDFITTRLPIFDMTIFKGMLKIKASETLNVILMHPGFTKANNSVCPCFLGSHREFLKICLYSSYFIFSFFCLLLWLIFQFGNHIDQEVL